MKFKQYIKYVAAPAKVSITIVIILLALIMGQAISIETVQLFAYKIESPPQVDTPEPNEQELKLRRMSNSARECLPDGTIHLAVDSTDNRHSSYDRYKEDEYRYVRDVNDKLLWEGPAKECPYDYISWTTESLRRSFGPRDIHRLRTVSPDWVQILEIPVGTGRAMQEIWRFLPAAECFVGYEVRGGRVGYIGPNGFSESESKAGRFGESQAFFPWCPEDSHSPVVLWQTKRVVYQISFEKREVTRVLADAETDFEGLHVHTWGARRPRIDGSKHKYKPLIYCRTWEGKQHIVLSDPIRQITITPPDDWEPWDNNYCRFAATEEGVFMQRIQFDAWRMPTDLKSRQAREALLAGYRARPKTHRFSLYKVDEEGGLDLLNQFEWTMPGQKKKVASRPSLYRRTQYAVNQFSPPLHDILTYALAGQIWKAEHVQRPNEIVRETLQGLIALRPEFGVWNWLLTALMTGLAACHAMPRRKSQPVFIFWLVFVALFNVAGLLTYLALNHTPVIKCAACGKTRGLNQPKCARCQAELPVPKPDKLDLIFDTQPTT